MNAAGITIGITTRDRPEALERCLRSLTVVAHLSPEVLVFDDASSLPVHDQVAGWNLPLPVRVLRDDGAPGYIAGRNRLVRAASAPFVLLMDDDAALIGSEAVGQGVDVLRADPRVAAVACAQCDRHGTRWNDALQPAPGRAACYVPSFIGFAHLVRREAFVALGGYRESFEFYGEEKDFGLRLIDAGYRTVYLPDALVVHEPDQTGRSQQRYLRYVTRNDCLNALYNDPLSRLTWILPARLALYFRMRRAWNVDDPWGWAWVLRELLRCAGSVFRERKPVSRQTVRAWKQLRRLPEPYEPNRSRREP